MTTTELHAADTPTPGDSVTVTPEAQVAPIVAETARTMTGRILPWDEIGRTNQGATKFAPGAINVPKDITRVKLLAGHSPNGVPVGHATSWESKADGLYMTFQLGSSDAATASLTAAAEHTIDAFSIEAQAYERKGTTVTRSILNAVALVPLPAYANARVDTVNASAPAPEPPAGTDPGNDTGNDTESTKPEGTDDGDPDDNDKETTMGKNLLRPGVMPGSATAATKTEEVHASVDDVLTYIGASVRGDSTVELQGELTDITDASMTDRAAPQWLGQLWDGVVYQREVIPLFTNKPLTARKAKGFRWVTKPGVAKWAGNKTEIPSRGASLEPVERNSQPWAGGNDLDRSFFDFGETEFLREYWEAMNESYAFETDQDFARFISTSATVIDGTAESITHAVARGGIKVKNAVHQQANAVLINPDDFESILNLSMLDAPKYLELFPTADPSKWVSSDFVDRGEVIVGQKAAATFFELPGSPLRAQAEHIAKGGRDAALFGYTSEMLNRPEALVKVRFDIASLPEPTPEG